MKESMQVQYYGMDSVWPTEDTLPGFKQGSLTFMDACQTLSKQLLRVLAVAFRMPEDFFTKVRSSQHVHGCHVTFEEQQAAVACWTLRCCT